MDRYSPEYEHKEITTSRREFAEVSARCCNKLIDGIARDLSVEDVRNLRILLTILTADIMTELFDDTLEVE